MKCAKSAAADMESKNLDLKSFLQRCKVTSCKFAKQVFLDFFVADNLCLFLSQETNFVSKKLLV